MFFTRESTYGRTPLLASYPMDRTRRRTMSRTLVGLVVVVAALFGSLAAGGHLDTRGAADSLESGARHAAVHEHATLRSLLPMRGVDRGVKSGLREVFALAVSALAIALAFAARRRLQGHTAPLLPSYVRFGAPRAPPSLQHSR